MKVVISFGEKLYVVLVTVTKVLKALVAQSSLGGMRS
jgi:hypothetical protein